MKSIRLAPSRFVLILFFVVGGLLSSHLLSPDILVAQERPPLHHEIRISFDLGQSLLHGTSRITIPKQTPLTLETGPLTITGITLETGDTAPLSLKSYAERSLHLRSADNEQILHLSWSLQTGEDTRDNLISDQGITLAGVWHPVGDRDMLFSLQATLPHGFTGITEADEISHAETEHENALVTRFKHPLRAIHFVAGPYDVQSLKVSEQTTLYSYFFPEDKELAQEYLRKGAAYLQRYESMIGPYPFKRFSIVENRLPTGYGMPTFTLLGQAVVRLPFITDTSLGHEILHSWFGNGVLPGEGGNWQEGLTTYLADQLYAEDAGTGPEYRKGQLQRYTSYVPDDNPITLTDFVNPDPSQHQARTIRAIGYDRSAMVFHMLRNELGDYLFFAAIRLFYEKYLFEKAGWQDIEHIFSAAAQRNMTPFFEQWLHRPDLPVLKVEKVKFEHKKDFSQVSFHLLQKTEKPFELIVPVRIDTLGGPLLRALKASAHDDLFEIQLDTLASDIIIDPQYDLLRALTPAELAPTWSLFDGAGEKFLVLPESQSPDIYLPIMNLLQESGAEIISPDSLQNSDFKQGSYLFTGNSSHANSLFAPRIQLEHGCTIDVRLNPLAKGRAMTMIECTSAEQAALAASKLPHYGKYSFLRFIDGRAVEKSITTTVDGIRETVLKKPDGMPSAQALAFDTIMEDLKQSRVIYVGENHTDFAGHLLQLQVIQTLHQQHRDLAIGMEMFPRGAQDILDQYTSGAITSEHDFLKKSRYFSVWGFDYPLYRPIIEYARHNRIPIVGLNLDKEIVSKVYSDGYTDRLSPEQLTEAAADRALDLPGYRNRLEKIHQLHDNPHGDMDDSFNGFLQSQAIWDETMAETIAEYLGKHPERKMVVLAGVGHVYKDNGIPPRVERRLDVRQSVVVGVQAYDNTVTRASQFDYLMDVPIQELEPSGKIGVVLQVEPKKEDPTGTQVRIMQVSHLGKAGEAGVEPGDIVVSVDGVQVETVDDLKIVIMHKKPGESINLKVTREHTILPDETRELTVVLSALDSMGMLPPSHPK